MKILYILSFSLLLGAFWQFGSATYIHAKAITAQLLLESAWQKTLNGETQSKPWPWADTWAIAKLTIPKLHKSYVVLAGASGRNLAFAPSHLSASVKPGMQGTAIIAGHRDTHFSFLNNLSIGEILELQSPLSEKITYEVTQTEIINTDREHLYIDPDTNQLLLVTCYPFDEIETGGPLRYVITLKPTLNHTNTYISANYKF